MRSTTFRWRLDDFYTWGNFIDDFHSTLIVYGTARQDEANHTLARRWQETLADAYVEILPPLVKDSELSPAEAASHDLMVVATLDDNALLARPRDRAAGALREEPLQLAGRDLRRSRGRPVAGDAEPA